MLAQLARTLRLLYETEFRSSPLNVMSYLLSPEPFRSLASGEVHPLAALQLAVRCPWWEDLWDADQFQKPRAHHYWPGWLSLCEGIARWTAQDH